MGFLLAIFASYDVYMSAAINVPEAKSKNTNAYTAMSERRRVKIRTRRVKEGIGDRELGIGIVGEIRIREPLIKSRAGATAALRDELREARHSEWLAK